MVAVIVVKSPWQEMKMRKLPWIITNLSLVSLPIASTVACGASGVVGNRDDGEAAERIFIKTSLSDVSTLSFREGERYSASQLGIDKFFNDDLALSLSERFGSEKILGADFGFVITFCDDVSGRVVARIEAVQGSSVVKKFLNFVQISGFKTEDPEQILKKVVQHLPSDAPLWTSLDQVKASIFTRTKFWSVSDLGVAHYFQFRNVFHRVFILDYDDGVGELEIVLELKIAGVEKTFSFKVAGYSTVKIDKVLEAAPRFS